MRFENQKFVRDIAVARHKLKVAAFSAPNTFYIIILRPLQQSLSAERPANSAIRASHAYDLVKLITPSLLTSVLTAAMEDREEDNCTATNLSAQDGAELRDVVSKVTASCGADATALFPSFSKLVIKLPTPPTYPSNIPHSSL